jgi:hypothetical protein
MGMSHSSQLSEIKGSSVNLGLINKRGEVHHNYLG